MFKFCGKADKLISDVLNTCRDCILKRDWEIVKPHISNVHKQVRALVNLSPTPPKAEKKEIMLKCNFCINECALSEKYISFVIP